MNLSGNIVDVIKREIYPGVIKISNGKIVSITRNFNSYTNFILPGLIDSHVHIESSMLTPSRFAQLVVPRGTIGVVSDPHEIANVMGVKGVEYMIEDARNVPLKCFFGVPSCVPATNFETSGYEISVREVEYLLKNGAYFLAEMMNFPGVIHDDKEVWEKLKLARDFNVPIDGHAPGLRGKQLDKYASGGISTDHESFSIEEALDKINCGIKTQIREGSAARNFEALHTLIAKEPNNTMLCTDDSHPDLILSKGHIDRLMRLGLAKGYSIFEMYQVAVINPVEHYKLPIGLLQEGDDADLIIVDNLSEFNVLSTYINGEKVAEDGEALFEFTSSNVINNFKCDPITIDTLKVVAPKANPRLRLMEADDGELLTTESFWNVSCEEGEEIRSSITDDILKIVVVNRYRNAKPVIGFIKNFGLSKGALASSVAHDSHNIVAIGCDDESLVKAINGIIKAKGGIVATDGEVEKLLELPVAGLMSIEKGEVVANHYMEINRYVAGMGCQMKAPFMTLAFMSLLVIPSLKIGDKGLFDVSTFSFTSLFVDDK